ncbi:hypothetical protein SCLCIDRAFT_956343 [Scleroderma citrinum Foug A]|uniref:Uncharacterized protein n=1 Tax=Scleroderma citrinum Foug A TaxID=1036808 RepID=A0A0C3E6R2_9AGAM|nr:hypothetical protein SCLCIDRAFT_956343 [Scleroderma citrinum Foug A]
MNLRKLKQLETHISGIDFRGEEYADEVGSIVGAPEPDRPSDIPPVLVFYAIRNIIHPAFIVGQIPDLLNLLTMVDIFRQFANNKSGEVLAWDQYYSKEQDNQEVTLLTAKEVRGLEVYQAQSGHLREQYILLLRNLCLIYIHYLWTAPESCLLAIRLNDFFPGSVDGFQEPSSFLFHEDLSEDERRVFTELKDECSTSMKTILEWESEQEELAREQG